MRDSQGRFTNREKQEELLLKLLEAYITLGIIYHLLTNPETPKLLEAIANEMASESAARRDSESGIRESTDTSAPNTKS